MEPKGSSANKFLWALFLLLTVSVVALGGLVTMVLRSPAEIVVMDQDGLRSEVQKALKRFEAGRLIVDDNPAIYRREDSAGDHTVDGFRPPSMFKAGPKQPGERRVLVVGDSVTYGLGIERHEDIYTAVLNSAAKRMGANTTFFNVAHMGYNVSHSMEAIRTFFSVIEPDFVIYHYNRNDGFVGIFPYRSIFETTFSYEAIRLNIPFINENDLVRLFWGLPRRPPLDGKHIFLHHPLFRTLRSRLFVRIKDVANALSSARIPFAIVGSRNSSVVDENLLEAMHLLDFRVEYWGSTFVYEFGSVPGHPDVAGHRRLAHLILCGLKHHTIFADLPLDDTVLKSCVPDLRRWTPEEIEVPDASSWAKRWQESREQALAQMTRSIDFGPHHEPRGLAQVFGRVNLDGFVDYRALFMLPAPGEKRPITLEFDMIPSPFVNHEEIRVAVFDEAGIVSEHNLPTTPGANHLSIESPESSQAILVEVEFLSLYYRQGSVIPHSARLQRIGYVD